MSLNRYAKRRDANEPLLFRTARSLGWLICPTDKPGDALGFYHYWFIVECKIRTGRLTVAQELFFENARIVGAPVLLWRSEDDIIRHTQLATDMYLSGKVDWEAFRRDQVKA